MTLIDQYLDVCANDYCVVTLHPSGVAEPSCQGMTFNVKIPSTVTQARFQLKRVGAPDGTLSCGIWLLDPLGEPVNAAPDYVSSTSRAASGISTRYTWYSWAFSDSLPVGDYLVGIYVSAEVSMDWANYIAVGGQLVGGDPEHPWEYENSNWQVWGASDLVFQVSGGYEGGIRKMLMGVGQ